GVSFAEVTPDSNTIIIGFDAEWVGVSEHQEAAPTPAELIEWPTELRCFADDPWLNHTEAHNNILSYQLACIAPNGRKWRGIAYTLEGALIHPAIGNVEPRQYPERWKFGHLLAVIIHEGIRHGCITRWPKKVIASAHWTRADLSAMADLAEIKCEFDTVHKTYATVFKP